LFHAEEILKKALTDREGKEKDEHACLQIGCRQGLRGPIEDIQVIDKGP